MDKITELNEVLIAGVKLVGDKIDVPLRNSKRNTKSGREVRLEKTGKVITTSEYVKIGKSRRLEWDKKIKQNSR